MSKTSPSAAIRRDMPPLSLRATVRPATVNQDKRTVEIVWSTGARVLRGFWEKYYEELSLDPKHVRLERLNNGAPFLNAHNGYDLDAVIGVVERAAVDGKQGTATIRFPKADDDEEADRIFRKVRDGIIQNISVGYRIHKFEQVEGGDEDIPCYRAVDWEPFELSAVPMGADDGAGFRAEQRATTNPCDFVTRNQETTAMPQTEQEKKAAADATAAERARAADIRAAVRVAKLPDEFAEKLIAAGVPIDEARKQMIDALAEADDKIVTQNHVRVGDDLDRVSAVKGITNALMHRADSTVKLEEIGRPYRGLTMLETIREYARRTGNDLSGATKMEVAAFGLGLEGRPGGTRLGLRAGYHSTSDFPQILADVANKILRRAYDEAPQTFKAIARKTTLPDFKPVYLPQLGEAPSLERVIEGAEFQRGTMGEGRETYQLLTYGKIMPITRQAIINDDKDAFSRVPMLFGRSARHLESDLVWSHFLSNPTMGDNVSLFNVAHGNIGTGLIGIDGIAAGRAAMRLQKGLDGEQFINVSARYLLVPAALETKADQFVSTNMLSDQAGNINVFAGRLQVVSEPRLDASSETEWYLAASPADIDTLEYAYLEGEEAPFLESRVGFDVDGIEIKCRHDFGTKAIDWRGFYQSDGVVVEP